MRTNTHAFAIELRNSHFTPLCVVNQAVMLEPAFSHHSRQKRQWFAIGFGLQVSDQRQFGHIKFQFTHDAFERAIGCFDWIKLKVKQFGAQHAVLQSHGVGVIAQQGFEFEFFWCHGGQHVA